MSEEGCLTDSTCCYQDDSGADGLRSIAIGLAAALAVSLLALLAAVVAWRRASGRDRKEKERHEHNPSLGAGANTAAGGTSPTAATATAATGTSTATTTSAAAAEAAAAAAAAGERAPSYSAAVAATTDPVRIPGKSGKNNGGGGGGGGGEEQRTSTESPDGQRPPLQLAVVEEGGGAAGIGHSGRGHILRTPAKDQQYRRSSSGVSLRSMKSAGSLNDMQQLMIPEPPSPASGGHHHQDDIQRLRALLDAERSRRVAAENAIGGGGGPSSRRGGSGACTPTSAGGAGTPRSRSRSYSGLHKSAMARAAEAHAVGTTTPKSSHHGGGSEGEMGAPSRSFGNLVNMAAATPRRSRLSYSALHKFPSSRTVEAHALEAAENGGKWVHSVAARLMSSGRRGGGGGGGGGGRGDGAEEEGRQLHRERERELLRAELPSVTTSILAHLFVRCRAEVDRLLQSRVDGLRAFVGGTEVVQLGAPPANSSALTPGGGGGGGAWGGGGGGGGGGGPKNSLAAAAAAGAAAAAATAAAGADGGMAPDTQELLYGELRRRYRTIAGLGRKELVALTARVLNHALGTEALKEAGRSLVHQTWPSFEPVVRSYLALFVECALQQPPIEFEDTAGTEVAFDPEVHRELARLSPRGGPGGPEGDGGGGGSSGGGDAQGRSCCVVFPATYASIARWPPSDAAKGGVVVFMG